MGLDLDYLAAEQSIEELKELLEDQPHGEREEIADDIIDMVEIIKEKWKNKISKCSE